MKHIAGETGSEYISRMTREGKTLGERGRMPWSHVAGLVTADDLRDAVNRGWVRVENVIDRPDPNPAGATLEWTTLRIYKSYDQSQGAIWRATFLGATLSTTPSEKRTSMALSVGL